MLLRMSSVDPSPLKDLETNPDASPADTLAILDDLKKGGLIDGDATAGYRLAVSNRQITVARVIDALSPGLLHVNPHGPGPRRAGAGAALLPSRLGAPGAPVDDAHAAAAAGRVG